jgi:hypothetical protein
MRAGGAEVLNRDDRYSTATQCRGRAGRDPGEWNSDRSIVDVGSTLETLFPLPRNDLARVLDRGLLVIVGAERGDPTESPALHCRWFSTGRLPVAADLDRAVDEPLRRECVPVKQRTDHDQELTPTD